MAVLKSKMLAAVSSVARIWNVGMWCGAILASNFVGMVAACSSDVARLCQLSLPEVSRSKKLDRRTQASLEEKAPPWLTKTHQLDKIDRICILSMLLII